MVSNFSRQTPGFLAIEKQIYSKMGFMTNPTIPGYSGGPVIDSRGNDLGLVSSYVGANNIHYYAPLSEIFRQVESDRQVDPLIPDMATSFKF